MKLLPAIISVLLFAFMLIVSYSDWNGIKVLKEYQYQGLARFIFQYLYYIVKTGLVIFIIIFAQKAGELAFKTKKFHTEACSSRWPGDLPIS